MLYNYGTREAWLASRRTRVGASEVAILFGLAPASWGSPYSLWAYKTGRLERPESDEIAAERMEWGLELEPLIARRYTARTGRKLWDGGGQYVVAIDPKLDVLGATPDGVIVDAPGMPGNGVLQIKTTNTFMAHKWDDGIPLHVSCQVQTEMGCLGYQWGSTPVLEGGQRLRWFDLNRDDKFIAEVREAVAWFWGFVKRDQPPPIDGSPATTEAIKRLNPNDSGDEVGLPPEAALWVQQWEEAKSAMATTERLEKERKMEAENKLRAAIGGATFGVLPDGRRLSLKTTERHIEPRDERFRTLRIESMKAKGKR
jgi:putative phage-type endonuclease